MKKTQKLKIWGLIQLIVGILLVILGFTTGRGSFSINMPLLMIGAFVTMTSFWLLMIGFAPQIAKFSSNVQSEVMDHAKDDIEKVYDQKTDIIKPAVRKMSEVVGDGLKSGMKSSYEEQLIEAQNLLDNKIITQEEFEQMRKRILGI